MPAIVFLFLSIGILYHMQIVVEISKNAVKCNFFLFLFAGIFVILQH